MAELSLSAATNKELEIIKKETPQAVVTDEPKTEKEEEEANINAFLSELNHNKK